LDIVLSLIAAANAFSLGSIDVNIQLGGLPFNFYSYLDFYIFTVVSDTVFLAAGNS
jgi:hypothetical protein